MNSRQTLLSCLLLVSSPSFAAASGPGALPDGAALEHAAARALHVLSTTPNTDEALLQLEQQMPNMGGFYLDAEGTAHVLLTTGASEGERQTARHIGNAVANIRSHSRGRARKSSSTVVEPARFRFSELARFRDYATNVLTLGAVRSLDVDERTNRVSVGVLTQEAVGEVRDYWAWLGLPAEALEVSIKRPIQAMRTLDDEVRPVPGGYKIWRGVFAGYQECTLGYPVYSSRLGQFGFITNSHCTQTSGGVENTSFSNGAWAIGTEKMDPTFFTSVRDYRCPAGALCRYSDSAFVAGASSSTMAFGAVAQPSNYCSLPATHCSLTVNSSSPVFYPHGFASAPLVGQDFEKIGQTTGWTYGPIEETCATMYDNGTGHYFLCSYGVSAGTDSGDSGSPVFTWDGTQNPIGGILWGGDLTNKNYFVFSHYSYIDYEMGQMYYY